jgi:NAD-dependent DNA ligase
MKVDTVHVAIDGVGDSRHSLGTTKDFYAEIKAPRHEIATGFVDVVADVEIRETITVHVGKSGAGTPTGLTETGLEVCLLEGSVSSIEVQNVGALVRNEKVRISVVIDVRDGATSSPPPVGDAGLVGDIDENEVAVVAKKLVFCVWGFGRMAVWEV